MVEYVLGSSPTTPKDLEPRMVSLRLVSNITRKSYKKCINLSVYFRYFYTYIILSFYFYFPIIEYRCRQERKRERFGKSLW